MYICQIRLFVGKKRNFLPTKSRIFMKKAIESIKNDSDGKNS